MYWKLYTPILLSVLIVLVQSASYIEVDENGDEYEVKRFHIQGRQLNDTNPTCVVTRRKRATVPQYGVDPADETYEVQREDNNEEEVDDNEEDDDSQDSVHPTEQGMLLDEVIAQNSQINGTNKKTVITQKADTTTLKPIVQEGTKGEEDIPNKAEAQKPIKNTLQKVTLILPQKSQSEEEEQNEETQLEEQVLVVPQESIQLLQSSYFSNNNGQHYVMAGLQQPQTSAVSEFFNILPTETDYEVPFSFTYEVNPASTSAVWSTGDDVQRPRQDESEDVEYTDMQQTTPEVVSVESPEMEEVEETDNGEEEIESPEIVEEEVELTDSDNAVTDEAVPAAAVQAVAQTANPRPTKKVKKVKKRPKKKKKKNKKKKNKKKNKKKKKKKKKNKNKRPNRRPIKNQKQRRRPYSPVMHRRKPSSTTTERPAYNRRRPYVQHKKRTTAKPAQGIRGHQRPKKIKKKPGAFTSTVSSTFTSDGNDSNIECIIINKPSTTTSSTSTTTTTTTRRPFWNILGRNVADTVGEPREYGNRKRVALRFAS